MARNLDFLSFSPFGCGRWDLNPHERIAHKILSLARLPVPTLPHIFIHIRKALFCSALATKVIIAFPGGFVNKNFKIKFKKRKFLSYIEYNNIEGFVSLWRRNL